MNTQQSQNKETNINTLSKKNMMEKISWILAILKVTNKINITSLHSTLTLGHFFPAQPIAVPKKHNIDFQGYGKKADLPLK